MKTFDASQLQAAQDWRPQLERFIFSDTIYVIETLVDYVALPARVQELIDLRNSAG